MKGDILLLTPEYRIKGCNVVQKIMCCESNLTNNILDKFVICLGGISGTMKSEISHLLQEKLYKNNVCSYKISLDDYYYTSWERRNEIRQEQGVNESVGMKEIDWNSVNTIIKSFYDNTFNSCVREINKYSCKIDYYYPIDFEGVRVLIVEGLYALNCKNFDFGIYLDSSIDNTYEFRMLRKKEAYNEFRKKVLAKEEQDVISLKNKADLIIKV